MKRKILSIALLMIFAVMLAWGTVAYFTAEDQAVNVLTIGSVDIEITEYTKGYNDETYTKIEQQMPETFKNIEPGQRIIKQVIIENRGKNKAWVRAKIIDTITSESNNPLNENVLTYNVNNLNDTSAQTADGEWIPNGDYYYFSTPLEPGKTAVLFDVVSFEGPGMGNAYQGCETDIQVIAQAVQYEGNNGVDGCDPESWPAEPEHISENSEFYVSGGGQP